MTAIAVTGGSDVENNALKKAFVELNSVDKTGDLKLESKAGKNVTQIVITCQDTSPMVKVETTVNESDKNGSFEKIESK